MVATLLFLNGLSFDISDAPTAKFPSTRKGRLILVSSLRGGRRECCVTQARSGVSQLGCTKCKYCTTTPAVALTIDDGDREKRRCGATFNTGAHQPPTRYVQPQCVAVRRYRPAPS